MAQELDVREVTEIDRHIREYLDHLSVEKGLSLNTVDAYSRDLSNYGDYCYAAGIRTVSSIDDAAIAMYSRRLLDPSSVDSALVIGRQEASSPNSVARVTSSIRGFHKFLVQEGLTEDNPAASIKPRTPSRGLPQALPIESVLAILAAPGNESPVALRDTALLEFMYATGARVSEAVGVDLDDFDLERHLVRVTGKGTRMRVLPFGSHASDAIDAYLVRGRPDLVSKGSGTSALFVNQRGKRLGRQSVWGIIKASADKAGVTEHVSPHVLRHSFATHLLDGGADVRVVQELLGHASVTTTQIYTLITVNRLREVYVESHPRALAKKPA